MERPDRGTGTDLVARHFQSRLLVAGFLAVITFCAPALADDQPNPIATLTGIDTPKSLSLDKEVQQLLDQSAEKRKAADAAMAKAQSNVQLMAESLALRRQALAKAEQAADERAHAATQERCVKPSEQSAQSTAIAGSGTSSYLCAKARPGATTSAETDPWAICACERQYFIGIAKEVADIEAHAKAFVGLSVSRTGVPDTEDDLKQFFSPLWPVETFADSIASEYEGVARGIQRNLVDNKIAASRIAIQSEPFARDMHDSNRVRNAVESLWRLYTVDVRWEIVANLSIARDAQVRDRSNRFDTLANELWDTYEAPQPHDFEHENTPRCDDDAYFSQWYKACERSDPLDIKFLAEAAAKLRPLAKRFSDFHDRLTRDSGAWDDFLGIHDLTPIARWLAGPDETPPIEFKITAPRPVNMFGYAHIGDSCWKGAPPYTPHLIDKQGFGPCHGWDQVLPSDLRELFPEIAQIDEADVILKYDGHPPKIKTTALHVAPGGRFPDEGP